MKLSFVIPTRNRSERLRATLRGLAEQAHPPEEIIVVDASDEGTEVDRLNAEFSRQFDRFVAIRAEICGAATQRNQGVALATGQLIGFSDDDIDFEAGCIKGQREFLEGHTSFAGVAATITNQAPRKLGFATRSVLRLIDGPSHQPFPGRVVGPTINIYPLLDPAGPDFVETEWLNLGATIYRREGLPNPPFDSFFTGYSMCEDVTLSSRVRNSGRLAVLRDSRVYHDTQTGDHKENVLLVAQMHVYNRFYVATKVLGRPTFVTWCQLVLWQVFCAIAGMRKFGRKWLLLNWGAVTALARIACYGK